MKSIFIVTAKCLVLASLIIVGCEIAETIDFNMDFSGTRTVSFQYQEEPGDIFVPNEPSPFVEGFKYIDSMSMWVDNIEGFHIDTSDQTIAHITYDFPATGIKITDQGKFDFYKSKVPEEFAWYFEEQPNTFEVISDKQLLWKALNKDLKKLSQTETDKLAIYLDGISIATDLSFPSKIIEIHPEVEGFEISKDKRSIHTSVDLNKVLKKKFPNEIMITLE